MLISPQEIRNLIMEFFESTEVANKTDLIYFLSFRIDDLPDLNIIDAEITKLESEGVLTVHEDDIFLVSKVRLGNGRDTYRLGPWNYKIIAEVILPSQDIDYSEIYERIDKLKCLRNRQNKFCYISSIQLPKSKNKVTIEIIEDEWEGTIILEKNQIDIETVWKIQDPLSEWEDFISLKNIKGTLKEIYMAMPAASNALAVYFAIKAIISDIHPEGHFKIVTAESIRARQISSIAS